MSIPDEGVGAFGASAAALWDKGWQPIPTLVPTASDKRKKPMVEEVTGYGREVTVDDVEEWLASPRLCAMNVGIRLPDGVIGLDIDEYGQKHGWDELKKAAKLHGLGPLKKTVVVTARDGVSGIRLYRVPKGLQWHANPMPGVEIITWYHRFVSAPPSLHHSNKIYEWYHQRDDVRHEEVDFTVDDLAELPQKWVDFLCKGELQRLTSADLADADVSAWLDARPGPDMCGAMRKAAEKAARELAVGGDGGAHDLATQHTWHLLKLAAEGHAGVLVALKVAEVAFIGSLAIRGDQARLHAAYDEWGRLVADGVSKLANVEPLALCSCGEPGLADSFADKFQENGEVEHDPEAEAAELLAAAFFTAEEYDNPPEPTPTEYGAFGGSTPLFYAEGVHWLQGESESGKSWVAVAVALEHFRAGHKVAYLDEEHTRAALLERLVALGATREEVQRFAYFDQDTPEWVIASAADQFSLLIVDGVTTAMKSYGKEGGDPAERLTGWVDSFPRKFKCSIMVDHSVKDKDNRGGWAYGTQAKKSVVTGSSWEVVCDEKFGRGTSGKIKLNNQKDKPGFLGEGRKEVVHLRFASDPATFAVTITRVAGVTEKLTDGMASLEQSHEVAAAVKALIGELGCDPKKGEVIVRLGGPKKGPGQQKFSKRINQAEVDGLIWQDPHENGKPIYIHLVEEPTTSTTSEALPKQ